jgi:aryl-alcohol dehydrogenase-like predicted oxidoreductase/enamine deaminase RidA (YjgF/YER057c/UK114 family)
MASDFQISPILTGLWQVADMERSGQPLDTLSAARALIPYVESGLSTFDVADHYGSSELIVGVLQREFFPQQPLQLLTKWVPPPGRLDKQAVREAVALSLRRMQLDTLPLLQYHAWNYADPTWLDQLFWLDELRQEGLIAHLGLTNFDTAHLKMILDTGIPIASNQVCFSLLDQRAQHGMCQLCAQYGVKLLAFGTLAGGFLSEKWLGQPAPSAAELATWSQMKYKRFIDQVGTWDDFQALLRVLADVGQERNWQIAQVASRFILDQAGVAGVIVGARPGQSSHLPAHLAMLQQPLDAPTRARVQAALQTLRPIPGDCGDEYRKPPFLTASGDLSHHMAHFPAPYATLTDDRQRQHAMSGTVWEDLAGFSRAVRSGAHIAVSGTTATHGQRAIGGSDAASQTHFVLDKIAGALQSLGGSLEDVIRTRIYIRDLNDWEAVARAHGQRFAQIQPANTMIRADLIGEEYLVEIEAEAYVK